jgi:hypothetical protein
MSSNLSNFYGAAAQTIPVLLLVLVVETTFLAGVLRSKRLEPVITLGNLVVLIFPALLAGPARATALPGKAIVLARPLRVVANGAFVFGSLLAAVIAEGVAFVGLAFDPKDTASQAIVIFVLIAIGLLLIETLAALTLVVIAAAQRIRGEAEDSSGTGGDSTGGNASLTD